MQQHITQLFTEDVYKRQKQDTPIFTAAETEQFSDEYIETILDHSMMDDYTLYQYLTDANSDMFLSLIHI